VSEQPQGREPVGGTPVPDVTGMGRNVMNKTLFSVLLGAAAAFGGSAAGARSGRRRMGGSTRAWPPWQQALFGLAVYGPWLAFPVVYLVTRSWATTGVVGSVAFLVAYAVLFVVLGFNGYRQAKRGLIDPRF
jgi:hypothetical protein